MNKRERRRHKPSAKCDVGEEQDDPRALADSSALPGYVLQEHQSSSLRARAIGHTPDATPQRYPESRRMFKVDDGTIDKIAKCLDLVVKLSLVVAAFVAIWKIYLFQETTQIICTSIETRPLGTTDRKYAEVTLKVTNSGKVRVTLVAGMLRIKSMESRNALTFRLNESDAFTDEVIIPNVFLVDAVKADYPDEMKAATPQPDYLQAGSLFFDPGETIKMQFLVEYQGRGLCNLVTRYDGSQIGSLWFEEKYEVLDPPKTRGGTTEPGIDMNGGPSVGRIGVES